MPTTARELHGLAWYGWTFTAVQITGVVGMVTAGDVADRAGPGKPLLAGLGTFSVGLAVAGSAPLISVFILGRALQGLGSGMVIVAIYVLIGDVYPEQLRPQVFGAISAAWVLPALVGPVIAGAVAERASWRAVFLGLLPLIAAGSAPLVPRVRRLPPRPATADPAGEGPANQEPANQELAAVGPAGERPANGGRHTASEGPALAAQRPADAGAWRAVGGLLRRRWFRALVAGVGIALVELAGERLVWVSLAPLAVGLLAVGWGLRPLLPPGTALVRRGVPAAVAFRGMLSGSYLGAESLVPLTLTVVHGLSPTRSGLPLMVGALGWAGAAWWQGKHAGASRGRLVRYGFLLVVAATLLMAAVSRASTPWELAYLAWILGGTGAGLTITTVSLQLLEFSPEEERGANSSALQISDSVLYAMCVGLGGTLVAAAAHGGLRLAGALLAGRARTASPSAGPGVTSTPEAPPTRP